MRRATLLPACLGLFACGLVWSCSSSSRDGGQDVSPAQFVKAAQTAPNNDSVLVPRPAEQSPQSAAATSITAATGVAPGPTTMPAVPPQPGERYVVDGLVGQINGQPIYASAILDPLAPDLARQGRDPRINREQFRRSAKLLITDLLTQKVYDALLLGEATRGLNEQMRDFVEARMKERHMELVRKWGKGSVSVADAVLRQRTGRGLDTTIDRERDNLVLQRYIYQEITMKINVTRRDIEWQYHNDIEQYSTKPRRVVRLIHTKDDQKADRIDTAIKEKGFMKTVCLAELNEYKAEENGLFSDNPASVFAHQPLNDALKSLKDGQASSRVKTESGWFWIYLEATAPSRIQPLQEVQRQIEIKLRVEAYRKAEVKLRERLFNEGSYDDIDRMAGSIVEIAMSRFAPQQ